MALLERLRWRLRMLLLAFSLKPIAGAAEGDGTDSDAATGDGAGDAAKDDAGKKEDTTDAGDSTDADKVTADDDWKAKSRKNEAALKRERKAREAAEAERDKLKQASQSDAEKAIEAAKAQAVEAAKKDAATEYAPKIRKLAIKAEAAKTFANPDLAVRLVEIEDEDLFTEEGEINTEALKSALDALLEENPGLKADATGGRPSGDGDGGKGGGGTSDEDMSTDDHLKAVQKHDDK